MDGLDPSLEMLVGLVARRDRQAFEALYQRTAAALLGVAVLILRRRDVAEEVLQEAFVRVWQRAGDFDPALGSARTWITTIVRHLAIDRHRRDARLMPLPDGIDERPDPSPDPMQAAIDSQDARRLRDCLDALEDGPRRAITLAYYNGLTHDELAAQLAAPLGTVKSWVRRGLLRLRGCLDA
ncbi:MAG: sigma-70 family RNA polymerase sigma factor [Gemmatimonas sp.]